MTSKVVSTHKVVRDNPVSIVDLHKGKSQKGQKRLTSGPPTQELSYVHLVTEWYDLNV